jgi:hypothetical protein
MNKFIASSFTIVALSVTASVNAATEPINGKFESGDLTGWYSKGSLTLESSTAIASGTAGYTQIEGVYSALIVAQSVFPFQNGGIGCEYDIWNIQCPQPLPFSPSLGPKPVHANAPFGGEVGALYKVGGYLAQDVQVTAGDTISWRWEAFGEARYPNDGLDVARFYATDGSAWKSILYSGSNQADMFQFPTTGTWSVYFGIDQYQDGWIYSALLLDSVVVTSVPEPKRGLSLLFGLLALASLHRRARIRGTEA